MASGNYRTTLAINGLPSFLWTQFLGAFNDNVFKIIVSFYAIRELGTVRGMSLAAATFVLPFFLFSGWSAYFADGFSKRKVLIAVKVLEVVAMTLATVAMILQRLDLEFVVLFLMGAHSTFFSPAKYGLVPEVVPAEEISRANGLLEMSTFGAIVLGTSFGGWLFELWHNEPLRLGLVVVGIAMAGTATSFGIPAVGAARPDARFSWNPVGEIGRGIKRLYADKTLWITVVGISYFWFLGALLQQVLLPWGHEAFGVEEAAATRLYTFLAIGIGSGSMLAGRLSGDKIELGLVPLGSLGLGVFSLVLVATAPHYWLASMTLVILGIAGGFFAVPLNALLQQRPDDNELGRVLATNNVLNTLGMLLAAAAFWALGDWLHLSLSRILVVAGVFTLVSNLYILGRLPDFFVRFSLWILTHTLYRIKIVGKPHIPTRGPALIIANHVSMIDGALIGACLQRFVRFMVYAPYYRKAGLHALFTRMHAIPIAASKSEVLHAIETARAELEAGHVVCIFVEGAISRTGNLLPFKRGFERIVGGLNVPIVPVYLDRVWGSIFSFDGGKFFWKLPRHIPYPVTVLWGAPIPSSSTAQQARQAILELSAEAMAHRRPSSDRLHTEFVRVARQRWGALAMADSTGQKLTYGRTLAAALALGRVLAARTGGQEQVGTVLPATVGAALSNLAVMCAGRVPVNLNFTIGIEAMQAAIEQASIRTIVTSRVFLAKANLPELPGMIFLEDLRKQIGTPARLRALVEARFAPRAVLRRRAAASEHGPSPLATIIFSSGSTGIPKGVLLTHANILANVDSLTQIFPMKPGECFIAVLPMFHSFGFTGTFWFPLLSGSGIAFHPNPLDAKTVGELAETYKAAMLIATPTFCQGYLRRCTREQFAHLKYAIVGAEKLREPLASEFKEKFGIPLLEGYGMTEMAPVVAVNRPNIVDGPEAQTGTKPGSVGHPIPGVAARVVDQETLEGPLVNREGLLLVKGPNLMAGYLHQPERTAEVIKDGWYTTGDLARIDEDGFIFITDRVSRFSKIGGEMVPHMRLEEAINTVLGQACSVVVGIPDEAKGERLVAFYTKVDVPSEALWEKLQATELPRLWLPRRDLLVPIAEIPLLGTGKIDLRRVKTLALERAGSPTPAGSTVPSRG